MRPIWLNSHGLTKQFRFLNLLESYEIYIQLEAALEYIVEEISIYSAEDYHIIATYQEINENAVMSLYLELQQEHEIFE
ncbi:Hypothetical protein Tcol_3069 [Trichococcus collinsii]|uniref:Uncharacterized protein n=1 Tax=Trichococcus collinsii TaxID=157076 RepID=A0A143ZD70_9LACT|nr:Hypothetical protein Tcol_3018 [Trichococcus collinsii]CZR10658.1 Hypothetical protein Tcol_3069 [Trichococcus collinsii]SEA98772.1 hypothetical protein SAMN04488525_1222 [Trichococcus collinsii]